MKLARIFHRRCDDYSGYTFVLAPDDWDDARIQAEAKEAQRAYLEEYGKALKTQAGEGVRNPGYSPNYDAHPDKTVAEVKAEWETARDAYKAWEADQRKTRQKFEDFLTDCGFVSLWSDDAAPVKAEVDWGHRHGSRIVYGNHTELDAIPTPAVMAGEEPDDEWF